MEDRFKKKTSRPFYVLQKTDFLAFTVPQPVEGQETGEPDRGDDEETEKISVYVPAFDWTRAVNEDVES